MPASSSGATSVRVLACSPKSGQRGPRQPALRESRTPTRSHRLRDPRGARLIGSQHGASTSRGEAPKIGGHVVEDADRPTALGDPLRRCHRRASTWRGHEQRSNGCCGVVVHDRKHVRVGLQGDRDVRVSEAFLHDTRVNIQLQRERRPRVPQTMQRDRRQMVAGHRPPERLIDTLRMTRCTVGLAKHKLIPPTRTHRIRSCVNRSPMLAENLDGGWIECNGPSTGLSLGLTDMDLPANCDHRLIDLRPTCLQVDIRPPQTERLTMAKPGRRDQHPQRRVLIVTRRLKKRAQRVGSPCFDRWCSLPSTCAPCNGRSSDAEASTVAHGWSW